MLRKSDRTLALGPLQSRSVRFVLAFHRSAEHAQEALAEAQKQHFNHSVAVYRTEGGRLNFYYTAPAIRIRFGFALVLAVVFSIGSWIFGANAYASVSVGLIGLFLAWIGIPWLGYGLPKTALL